MALVLLIMLGIAGLGVIVWLYYRDRRYLKRPVREVLSPSVQAEIKQEQREFARRRERFSGDLQRAQKERRLP